MPVVGCIVDACTAVKFTTSGVTCEARSGSGLCHRFSERAGSRHQVVVTDRYRDPDAALDRAAWRGLRWGAGRPWRVVSFMCEAGLNHRGGELWTFSRGEIRHDCTHRECDYRLRGRAPAD